LKKIAFILLLFFSSLSWTQNFVIVDKLEEESNIMYSEVEYNALLRFTPKSFVSDVKSRPQNRVLQGDLNSISSLELRYAYQQQLKLNESEIQWLENEINQLAVAFFLDKKPIMLKKTGDYTNCKGQGIETIVQNNVAVTVVYFCYVYIGGATYEDRFIDVFNKRTEKLIASKQSK